MSKKRKQRRKQKQKSFLGLGIMLAVLGLGTLGVVRQTHANLLVHASVNARTAAIALAAAPHATPVVSAPSPKVASKPVPTPLRTSVHTVATVRRAKVVAPVVASPHSVVSHLVAVVQPTVSPGLGSGEPSATTTPTPTPVGQTAPVYAYTSSNWAGYLASGGKFSDVSGSWNVPNVRGNGAPVSGDATWIGIGGVTTSDLIQVGTDDSVTKDGQVNAGVFYEMLPASETPVPSMTISPGDHMSATLLQLSATQWQISITDTTQDESFSTSVTYTSTNSTAEWIEEDPSFASGHQVPFDRFGSASFSDAAATQAGISENLLGVGAQAIIMQNGAGQAVATPSSVDGSGSGFVVTGSSG
jgi:hypothetical protein